jgi:hypothetical protein
LIFQNSFCIRRKTPKQENNDTVYGAFYVTVNGTINDIVRGAIDDTVYGAVQANKKPVEGLFGVCL